MNNQQLIQVFPPYPQHAIHLIDNSNISARWLTFTAQLPRIGGQAWEEIRQNVLDALYADWKQFETATFGHTR